MKRTVLASLVTISTLFFVGTITVVAKTAPKVPFKCPVGTRLVREDGIAYCDKNGVREGPFISWYDNGRIDTQCLNKDGKRVSCTHWSEDGKDRTEATYDDQGDKVVSRKVFKNGKDITADVDETKKPISLADCIKRLKSSYSTWKKNDLSPQSLRLGKIVALTKKHPNPEAEKELAAWKTDPPLAVTLWAAETQNSKEAVTHLHKLFQNVLLTGGDYTVPFHIAKVLEEHSNTEILDHSTEAKMNQIPLSRVTCAILGGQSCIRQLKADLGNVCSAAMSPLAGVAAAVYEDSADTAFWCPQLKPLVEAAFQTQAGGSPCEDNYQYAATAVGFCGYSDLTQKAAPILEQRVTELRQKGRMYGLNKDAENALTLIQSGSLTKQSDSSPDSNVDTISCSFN